MDRYKINYAYLVFSKMQGLTGSFVSYNWLELMYKLRSCLCIYLTSRSDGLIYDETERNYMFPINTMNNKKV